MPAPAPTSGRARRQPTAATSAGDGQQDEAPASGLASELAAASSGRAPRPWFGAHRVQRPHAERHPDEVGDLADEQVGGQHQRHRHVIAERTGRAAGGGQPAAPRWHDDGGERRSARRRARPEIIG